MLSGFETPIQLWLEIPATVQSTAWQQSQAFSTAASRWNAYLNQLCVETFLHWWRDTAQSQSCEAAQIADPSTSPELWEVMNGVALTLDHTRLVLIPSEAIDTSELRTPQEWVDIPSWAGDYYLAAQVNPDEGWIRFWGYTSHHQIKANAHYEAGDRTYTLPSDALIADLNVLWVIRQLNAQEVTRGVLPPLPELTIEQAELLLEQLSPKISQEMSMLQSPRLMVSFEQWGSLLQNVEWRSRLLSHYRSTPAMAPQADTPALATVNTSTPVRLSQWFQNVFEAGWESLESLFGEANLAYSFRRTETAEGIRRVKLVSLETTFQPQSAVLMISLTPEIDGRVEVQVQLRPTPGDVYLPADVSLRLLSVASQPLQFTRSRQQDNYIQLKRFRCLPGWEFIVQIELNGTIVTEHFIS
ncbi:DUF1822 family protein [Oscillatoria sp. FACHB-1407]|uniref:DUF1822 family protein n=1 Tax=Oscillatoria sp. FACHB-1407 TaxID=2692847 RepID=UPI001687A7C1|nr:DUF1822 family protein [Oscillatoria sp. FACHB-1407]MBD2459787.1 DUF1822 family protein [Oscillatoria sp. FACHB-1407]